MVIIAGCVIVRDNKILMVQEAKESCYGQWNFPAGHVEKNESITDAAIREVYEETGYKVKLTGVLPICMCNVKEEQMLLVRFTAEVIKESTNYNKEEILDVKWLDIEEIKHMTEKELRGYETTNKFIEDFEKGKVYPLEIFDETKYNK